MAGLILGERRGSGWRFFSLTTLKWASALTSVGLAAAGVSLWALDGRGTCRSAPGAACPSVYRTRGLGIGLTVGAGIMAAASAYLFYRDATRVSGVAMAPFIGPKASGIATLLWF